MEVGTLDLGIDSIFSMFFLMIGKLFNSRRKTNFIRREQYSHRILICLILGNHELVSHQNISNAVLPNINCTATKLAFPLP